MFRLGQRLDNLLDLGVDNLVSGEARQLVQDVQNLKDNIVILFPSLQADSHYTITVKLDHLLTDPFISAPLYPSKQLDRNPLLCSLHQRSHDLRNAILIKSLRLNVVDIFLVVFSRLLLSRFLGDRNIPSIAIVNSKRLDRSMREFRSPFSLSLAAQKARTIWLAAITWLRVCAVPVNVVVENELLASFDVPLGKYAHTEFIADHPFIDVAIGVT